ncbi:MAG: DUF4105 domain-containing protein [Balneolaceae bacterium]|nr:DUF4105 domain-containing protein [Balneolaceae bacterium]
MLLIIIPPESTASTRSVQETPLSESASISLITILPGEAPEELFGHSALRVYDPEQNLDLLFNYGTFQFDDYFLMKFIYGDLNYFLSIAQTPRAADVYRQRRRPMIEQELNFTRQQRQDLYQFLMMNTQEEYRYYQYDFLFDNCSTRIRDALQNVLLDDLRFASLPDPGLSFRELIAIYIPHLPFLEYGFDLLLGTPVDETADPWDVMFLPDFLMEAFDKAEIRINGEWQPLVSATKTILEISGYETVENAIWPWPSLLFWTLFFFGSMLTFREFRSGKRYLSHRWFDIPLFLFAGVIGLLIAFLWFISLHQVTASNWNLAWAWPLHLVLAGLLFRRDMASRWLSYYLYALTAACLLFLGAWLMIPQALHPAVIPLLLLITVRSGSLARFANPVDIPE